VPFLIPYITLSPFIIFCPHVFKIPYHLFARILLLQHITTPPEVKIEVLFSLNNTPLGVLAQSSYCCSSIQQVFSSLCISFLKTSSSRFKFVLYFFVFMIAPGATLLSLMIGV